MYVWCTLSFMVNWNGERLNRSGTFNFVQPEYFYTIFPWLEMQNGQRTNWKQKTKQERIITDLNSVRNEMCNCPENKKVFIDGKKREKEGDGGCEQIRCRKKEHNSSSFYSWMQSLDESNPIQILVQKMCITKKTRTNRNMLFFCSFWNMHNRYKIIRGEQNNNNNNNNIITTKVIGHIEHTIMIIINIEDRFNIWNGWLRMNTTHRNSLDPHIKVQCWWKIPLV